LGGLGARARGAGASLRAAGRFRRRSPLGLQRQDALSWFLGIMVRSLQAFVSVDEW